MKRPVTLVLVASLLVSASAFAGKQREQPDRHARGRERFAQRFQARQRSRQ